MFVAIFICGRCLMKIEIWENSHLLFQRTSPCAQSHLDDTHDARAHCSTVRARTHTHGRYIAVAVVVGGHCHILPTNSLY